MPNVENKISKLMLLTNLLKLSINNRLNMTFQDGASFVEPSCYLCFMVVFGMLLCLFLATLPAGKGLSSWLSYVFCICHFPISCPGSGVVLACTDSRSLPSSLLL